MCPERHGEEPAETGSTRSKCAAEAKQGKLEDDQQKRRNISLQGQAGRGAARQGGTAHARVVREGEGQSRAVQVKARQGLIDLIRESLQTCLTKLLSEQNKTTTDMDNCVTAELFNNTNVSSSLPSVVTNSTEVQTVNDLLANCSSDFAMVSSVTGDITQWYCICLNTIITYNQGPPYGSNSTNFPSIVDPITNETIVCNQTNSDIRLFNGGNLTAATTLANLTTTTTLAISPLVAGLIDLIRESLQTCLTKLLSEQNKTTTDMDNCVTAELFNNTNVSSSLPSVVTNSTEVQTVNDLLANCSSDFAMVSSVTGDITQWYCICLNTIITYNQGPPYGSNSTNFPSIVDPITNETIVCNQTNSDIRLFNGGNLTAATTLANLTTTTTLAISPLVAAPVEPLPPRPKAFKGDARIIENGAIIATVTNLVLVWTS
ncbi:uncharacterized protein LOC134846688 [Symsagittifera roscoffensis]|uniref:uncharacterized protein LOC134846688 n=1 Tax=Symsagittifera roscoffensis TaxID=84072 RepID=UPI00307C5B1A